MSLEREGSRLTPETVASPGSRSEMSSPGAPAPQESYTAPDAGPGHRLPSELSERETHSRNTEGPLGSAGQTPFASRSESSEAPYPEAPLASRKADPKPPPRWIDPEVFGTFHARSRDCLTCGYYRASAHHLVRRSQGGDDVMENLIPLCGSCHGALHDGNSYHAYGTTHTPEGVRNRIGAFLTSEAGSDHLNYVKRKLGDGAGAFLERYGVDL